MRHPSLQRRMLWLVGVPVIALWLAMTAGLAWRGAHETREMFDRGLMRTAASVLPLIEALPPGRVIAPADFGRHPHALERRPEIIVRAGDRRTILNASTLPAMGDSNVPHFRTVRWHDHRWRVYQRWDARHRYWIQVAALLHDREQLMTAGLHAFLISPIILLLLLPLTIWFALRRGFAPLRAVSRAIRAQPGQTPTLARDGVPSELLPLTRAVDTLVADLNATLQRERRFTADAAHELRHPLAVLRMELDLADVSADSTTRRTHLQRSRDGLNRMERLVSQLLTLARVESLDQLPDAGSVDIVELARNVVSEAAERAAPRDIALSLRADQPANVRASAGLLEIAVRNLVDNAIAHGKLHGNVDVSVTLDERCVEVMVEDDGPGMDEAQMARIGERFLREGRGHGSGLGLSIVQAIAALHAGSLVVSRACAGGARAALRIPRAT